MAICGMQSGVKEFKEFMEFKEVQGVPPASALCAKRDRRPGLTEITD